MDNDIKDELQDDIFTQNEDPAPTAENYNDDSIVHLEDMEHIRRRPGMYIGKLGDGASQDDGIYVLIKEVIDNSIDEFTSGFGKKIEVTVNKIVFRKQTNCRLSQLVPNRDDWEWVKNEIKAFFENKSKANL